MPTFLSVINILNNQQYKTKSVSLSAANQDEAQSKLKIFLGEQNFLISSLEYLTYTNLNEPSTIIILPDPPKIMILNKKNKKYVKNVTLLIELELTIVQNAIVNYQNKFLL